VKKLAEVSVSAEVAFHDVDSLGIVWHGHYYKYFELARTALYRSRGFDIQDMHDMGYIFPVIESQCRYVQPLKYGQTFTVSARFKAWDRYIHVAYTITDVKTKQRCAYRYTKQAACLPDATMLLEIPESVIHALQS